MPKKSNIEYELYLSIPGGNPGDLSFSFIMPNTTQASSNELFLRVNELAKNIITNFTGDTERLLAHPSEDFDAPLSLEEGTILHVDLMDEQLENALLSIAIRHVEAPPTLTVHDPQAIIALFSWAVSMGLYEHQD